MGQRAMLKKRCCDISQGNVLAVCAEFVMVQVHHR